ncbi:Ig-like domain-containing protein [Emticicia fluvialis]|uniref:Ig-like domain-containing protein n=1 Tax=Emticicia fluvialis TaxID=2974474 RepID=UPI002165E0BD|nr:Ig-like domain-containing protein [Emticicia fluvialis]
MKKLTILFIGLCLAACSKEDPMTINQPNGQLKYDGTHQFTVKKGGNSVSGVTWKSSDTKVGTVDNSGNFKARKIGKTDVTASTSDGSVSASIEIFPYTTFFAEPVVDFGLSKASVKSKEKRKLEEEATEGLLYTGENSKIENVAYTFSNNRLEYAAVLFQSTSAVVKEATTYMKERYPVSGVDGSEIYFFSDNNKYLAVMGVDEELGLVALYMENTTGARKELTPKQAESFKKALAAFKARR